MMLLTEDTGHFHQVPGWDLNCAVVGAVLAEPSLSSRIDTDLESLYLVDGTETDNPALDPILDEIAGETVLPNAQYWIQRLAPRAESIIDLAQARLVDLNILEHHSGEIWTLARTAWQSEPFNRSPELFLVQYLKTRLSTTTTVYSEVWYSS